jgi:hypothetical protein
MDEPQTPKNNDTISIVGYSALFIYSLIKILNYYGVQAKTYAPYLAFYIFLIFCKLALLPTSYTDFDMKQSIKPVASSE